ncbi:hypothetical protein Kolga_gp40 [Pelagibacter phage Kolga EXVC016S]|nr:hypothetical protein Kolga_gp40 [Pelagibacter phage Kolga EXVC016S]|tara:strand:- start:408 stop:686 length:279 start_codon:yes stop_codon:yes gene_type:complete
MDNQEQIAIWEKIAKMNKAQLDGIIGAVKTRQRTLAAEMSNTFKVGDKVMFGRSTGPSYFGTVYKINRTKAVVDTGMSGRYTVPFSMIQFAK